MLGPTSHSYFSQRLRLHYVDWGNVDKPSMLLIHGGRDHCRNWDWVAEYYRKDYHVIAPDLRGHGDSQWMIGGAYNQIDYVYDIAQLIHQKKMEDVVIMGHSLGGAISLLYTALHPQNVKKLIAIEGMGPPPKMIEERINIPIKKRLEAWFSDLRQSSARRVKRYPSIEEAFERMKEENPHLSTEQARHLTIHGSNQNEDGTYSWKFDNYVRNFSPIGLPFDQSGELYQNITCPTLLVRGEESWASDPEKDGRVARFRCDIESTSFKNAGHWVHHDQLEPFVERVNQFLMD